MPGFVVALIVVLHVVVCIALMASILLQSGKGGGLAGAFGAGSSQTLFGGRGAATFLSRATTALAVVFFVTSLTLGLHASRSGSARQTSLIQEEARKRSEQRGTAGGGAPSQPVTGTQAPGTQGVTPQAPTGPIPGALVPETPAPSPAQPSTAPPAGGSNAPPAAGGNASPATGTTK
jgi:preprotein translocase subunit SecG